VQTQQERRCNAAIPFSLFVRAYQQNQQPFSSIFLSQQNSEQYFQQQQTSERNRLIADMHAARLPQTREGKQCLLPSKFQKFYKISRHIESLTHAWSIKCRLKK
jgi:hypothetical protein